MSIAELKKKKKKGEARITVSIRLPKSKSDRVRIKAAEIGISKSVYVERAIDQAFRSPTPAMR